MIRRAEKRDAGPWIDHLRRICWETPFMLQGPDDPLPTPLEQKTNLEELDEREGSLALVAVRPGEPPGRQVLIGSVTLANGRSRRTEHVAELSMGVGRLWWGRGIGSMLMDAALTWARRAPMLGRVSLLVFADNLPARRLYDDRGFVLEGVLERYVRWDGRVGDLHGMALDVWDR
ncbi:MAG: GNAT family N-acetyltransferase [Deltaproteobacteria bacterium]|nr:GNAT family N-acetyltransferase [Deltaproteobacteria bacterium]